MDNSIDETSNYKTGDTMKCRVIGTKPKLSDNDLHVFTPNGANQYAYIFYPMSKNQKCISFLVRSSMNPHLLFSDTPYLNTTDKLEIILEYQGHSYIRDRTANLLSTYSTGGVVNDKELRGFWVNWDDNILQIGRNTESVPFLKHQIPYTVPTNYMGILSWLTNGEWIFHKEPKCGPYEIHDTAVTECKLNVPAPPP